MLLKWFQFSQNCSRQIISQNPTVLAKKDATVDIFLGMFQFFWSSSHKSIIFCPLYWLAVTKRLKQRRRYLFLFPDLLQQTGTFVPCAMQGVKILIQKQLMFYYLELNFRIFMINIIFMFLWDNIFKKFAFYVNWKLFCTILVIFKPLLRNVIKWSDTL